MIFDAYIREPKVEVYYWDGSFEALEEIHKRVEGKPFSRVMKPEDTLEFYLFHGYEINQVVAGSHNTYTLIPDNYLVINPSGAMSVLSNGEFHTTYTMDAPKVPVVTERVLVQDLSRSGFVMPDFDKFEITGDQIK